MNQTLKIILGSALITAAILKTVPALAEAAPMTPNISIVHTSDLDLTSASGRQTLDARLAHAAYDVCGYASDTDLIGKKQVRACRIDVLAKARDEVAQLTSGSGEVVVASSH